MHFTSFKFFLEYIHMFFAFLLPRVPSYTKLMQLSKDLDSKVFCSNIQDLGKSMFLVLLENREGWSYLNN